MTSSISLAYRFLMVYCLYFLTKVGLLIIRLCGYLKLADYKYDVVGTSVILAPASKLKTILEGIKYLQRLDVELFQKLTVQRKYVFWYHRESRASAFDIYPINDRYLNYGKEGVVICLLQAILDRTMKDTFGRFQIKSYGEELQKGRLQILAFLKQHSFAPELIKQYQKLAEKIQL